MGARYERRSQPSKRAMKTFGNLILMTVICIVIFWIFMALRPAQAQSNYTGRGVTGVMSGSDPNPNRSGGGARPINISPAGRPYDAGAPIPLKATPSQRKARQKLERMQ